MGTKKYCFQCAQDEVPLVGPSADGKCVKKSACLPSSGQYLYDDGTLRACLAVSCAEIAEFCAGDGKCGFTRFTRSDVASGLCVENCGPDKYLHDGKCLNNC